MTIEELFDLCDKNNLSKIKVLSLEYKIGKERKWTTNFKGKIFNHKTNKKEAVGIWTPLINIARRYVENYDIYRIETKYGETEVSKEHSLVYLNEDNIEKITPENFINNKKQFIKIQRIKHDRNIKIRYGPFKILDYNINTFEKKEALSRIIGAYLSEGCLNKYKHKQSTNYSIIISNTKKEWLDNLNKDFKFVFNLSGSFSKSKNCYNLVFYSKELIDWFEENCGKYSKNKKIPYFIFEFNKKCKMEFLKKSIEGDGSFYKKKWGKLYKRLGYGFSYTSNSKKLISGLSFILTQLRIWHSIYYRKEKESYSIFTNNSKKSKVGRIKYEKRKYTGYIYDITTKNNLFVDGLGLVGTHNTFMVMGPPLPWNWYLTQDFSPAKTVWWIPSDGEGRLPGNNLARCEDMVAKLDRGVAMSRFCQKQLKEQHGIDVDYVPHGTEPYKHYYPLSQETKKQMRRQVRLNGIININGRPALSPMVLDLSNKFVILNVARNQGRKNLDSNLDAFKEFLKLHQDAVLINHYDPYDAASVFDHILLAYELGIYHKVFFTGMSWLKGFSINEVRNLYNIADAFFLLTSGEGFGIPFIEAMSCELPVVTTDYTTGPELIIENGKAGEVVEVPRKIVGSWNVRRAIADPVDAAKKLDILYKNPELRQEYGKAGREKVLKFYNNEVVTIQWDKLLKKVVNK